MMAVGVAKVFNAIVNQMTGWQRNQWARAGYPGLTGKDFMGPARFLAKLPFTRIVKGSKR